MTIAVSFLLQASNGPAMELSGPISSIIDADTVWIGNREIRLYGIDAPETAQRCQLLKGTWDCAAEATAALEAMVLGEVVHCKGSEFDDYGRLIAICSTDKEPDINARLVEWGLAWAYIRYTNDYVSLEAVARSQRIGIWQAKTQPAWEFRARRWKVAVQISPNGCPIKGNINQKGEHIYHTPWSRWYTKTKVSLEKGEKWFCDEAEAKSAGWRAPYR
jgi:endonuclease YncB( thermonuclease family)